MKIRRMSFIGSGIVLLSMLSSFIAIWQVYTAYNETNKAQMQRQEAMNTVNDFQMQMLQLNKLIKAYISTANPRYLLYYYDLLAIQDGKKPFPPNYFSSAYWDMVIAKQIEHKLPQTGQKYSIVNKMKQQSFTPIELLTLQKIFDITKEEKDIEQIAFAATQGLYDISSKQFVEDGKIDLPFAASLIYGDKYQKLQAKLGQTVTILVNQTDTRTNEMVSTTTKKLSFWLGVAIISISFTVLLTVFFLLTFKRVLLSPIESLTKSSIKIAHANYTSKINVQNWVDELRQLGLTFNMMTQEIETDIQNREANRRELEQAKKIAEEATKAKSMFLTNMSHELRTPLNAIIGMSYLALQSDLSPKQKEFIEQINVSAKSLLLLINDLLDFSKIEAGKMTIELLPFNLHELLQNTLKTHHYYTEEKGIDLSYEVENNSLFNDTTVLIGDTLRITQILNNLLSNAIKFTQQGFVKLSTQSRIVEKNKIMIQIIVEDSGIGMNEEQQSRLFQEFTQANNATTRKYGGTGLGLAISKNLAQLMNGTLKLYSEEAKGSTFVLELPFDISNALFEQKQSFIDGMDEKIAMDKSLIDDSKVIFNTSNDNMLWIKDFIRLVEESNFDAIEVWDLHKSLLVRKVDNNQIKKISMTLSNFDFENALLLIKEIKIC